ncbi:MAG: hypothetical protein GY821_01915 [Gammaproteobacteria bacterium]|nr:hypothetical protein [Gammaproteobacteria bacterium]
MSEILDASSVLGSKSELDLFAVPPTQVVIESGYWVEIFPKNTVTNDGPYEFEVNSDPLYLDLSSNMLYMVVRIVKGDGTVVAKAGNKHIIAPINLFGKTFFKQCKVWLNSKLAYDSGDTYAYRAYLETLLNYGSDAKTTQLQSCMYVKDTAGKMVDVDNHGYDVRGEYANESRHIELMGAIHSDIFNQDRLMLNRINVRLELHRNSNAFSLIGVANHGDCKIEVIKMSWFIRKIEILSSLSLSLETHLSKNMAKYPIRRIVCKTLHINGGRRDSPNNVLFSGQIPRRMLIGCVEKDAFFGNYRHNPFDFKNFNITQIRVMAGDNTYPRNPMLFDFPNKRYTRAYMGLFEALNIVNEDKGVSISYGDYLDGYCLFGFDLSPDCSDGSHWQLIREGSTSISIEFGADTPAAGIKVIVLAEFDNLMNIDKWRNVFFDYAV